MSIVNVIPAIGILGNVVTVFEKTETIVNHRPVDTTGADRQIFGVIQPAGPRDLELLPEGDRTNGSIVVHSQSQLYISDRGTTSQSFIRHDGLVYRVAALAPWVNQYFRKYVAVLYQPR